MRVRMSCLAPAIVAGSWRAVRPEPARQSHIVFYNRHTLQRTDRARRSYALPRVFPLPASECFPGRAGWSCMQFFAPALYTAGRADRACTQSFAPALRRSQVLYIPKRNKLTFLSVTDTYVHTHIRTYIRTYVRTYAYSENVTRSI